jgi:hypothetical protein
MIERNGVVTDQDKLEYLKSTGLTFGTVGADVERIKRDPGNGHYSVTETYWFEILVPSADLIAHVYVYMRPNLSICSAGVWISRGFSEHPLQMDHFNYQAALPMPREQGNTIHVPEIGLKLTVIEPLKHLEITYEPPNNNVRVELFARAAMAPAVRNTGKHFNQFMRYTGTIRIGAETIEVDDISMRDRSWGEARAEDPTVVPVTAWASGFFKDKQIAFNFIGFDDPKYEVEWAGVYPIPSDRTLMDGWYLENGLLTKVVRMSKRSVRDPRHRMALSSVQVEFEDAAGRTHHLLGKTRAACWMQNWPNVYVWLPLMEWDLNGVKGWGDCQEYLCTDYAKRFWR